MTDPLHIDCDACVMHGTDACDDCIVTFIVNRPARSETDGGTGGAVVVDADQVDALRLFKRAGLVPGLRHRTRAS